MTDPQILAGVVLAVMTVAGGLALEGWFSRQRASGIIPAWIDITLWLGVLLALVVEIVAVVAA